MRATTILRATALSKELWLLRVRTLHWEWKGKGYRMKTWAIPGNSGNLGSGNVVGMGMGIVNNLGAVTVNWMNRVDGRRLERCLCWRFIAFTRLG